MKKYLLTLLLAFFTLSIFASDYDFLVLGDIHFDGEEYHTTVPKLAHRKKERIRNLNMWKSGKSALVLSAAAKQLKADMPFVIQLGDFTQGDCDGEALQEKMFADGFAAVKKYFPKHKLLPVKGNHDVRVVGVKGACNAPAVKSFLPLIAKELGRKKISGNYAVMQGKDLFIFVDGFAGAHSLYKFVDKTLKQYPDSRHTFFITHLPLLPCSKALPSWLVPNYRKLVSLLAKRNTIVLCAHTHVPSYISIKTPAGEISQIVVSSMGNSWAPGKEFKVQTSGFETFCKSITAKKLKNKKNASALDFMRQQQIKTYEIYSALSGFAIIKVKSDSVTAEFYADDSGKPRLTRTLKGK